MNFLKKGPELKMPDKMPELKVPGFASDIYQELQERRLLPLVVVLVVAIFAVPIALSESAETTEPLPEAEAGISAADRTQVVVAKSSPGLRDYRKRLDELSAKDPFKDRVKSAQPNTGSAPATESPREPTPSPIERSEGGSESPPVETTPTPSAPSAPTETSPDNPGLTYYSFAIDVRVVPVSTHGKPSKAKPEVRRDLPELTALPSRKTPAIVFMGVTKDTHKALMLISSNVKGIFGDNVCAVGGETCELLAMAPGVPQTFIYGGSEKVYRIEIIDVNLVKSDEVNKAPLGKPKNGNGGGGAG